jgi:hypothetical protein
MALAIRSLGADRGEWAQAMAAEYSVAEDDGRPLRFALGCLMGAWQMMLANAEGRFVLSSHAFSIGILVPVAGMLALAALFGFPFLAASDGIHGYLSGSGTHVMLLNAGSWALAPSLTLLMLLMALYHLPLAWWILDRDWERVGAANRFGAAIATTLTIMTCCAALDPTRLMVPLGIMAGEIGAISALAWWHEQLSGQGPFEAFDPSQ